MITENNLQSIIPVFRVTQLARALNYYISSLGFSLEFEYSGTYAGVQRENCHLHLKCAPPTPRDQAKFEAEEHIDVCVQVKNIDDLTQEFKRSGVIVSMEPRTMPYGREMYVRDLDGYILGFIQTTPRF
jgi:uncharacterized glyoxalase superfamily protein PhnB